MIHQTHAVTVHLHPSPGVWATALFVYLACAVGLAAQDFFGDMELSDRGWRLLLGMALTWPVWGAVVLACWACESAESALRWLAGIITRRGSR